MRAPEDSGGESERVEGRNAVLQALRGPREVKTVYVARGVGRSGVVGDILTEAGEQGVPVVELSRAGLTAMALTSAPQGVLARVSPYRYMTLDELLAGLEADGPAMVLALDGVEDPRNFGSLLRIADATGTAGVIIRRRRSCAVTAAVGKASAGAVEHVRLARVANISDSLGRLRKEGFWVVGADAGSGEAYWRVDLSGRIVVVLGGEGKGLSRLVKEGCDVLVRLPMLGRVGSLNVSSAGSVLLYEALRQREGPKPGSGKGCR